MLLVRHSAPELDPSAPSEEWRLSEDGRRRCGPLAERLARYEPRVLLSSSEPKARETAELVAPALGLEMQVSDGLRETARRTVGWLAPEDLDRGIRELVERPGEVVFGEESAAAALARFEAAVAGLPEPAVVVTHGTVLSLFAAPRIGRDAYELWGSLELPDVVEVPWSS
ncbi:MAG TPA: histidine phosphatase family protein [Gaiellaceae bacterium]|nr:histidine phosphatase family protein [Gaiellaceae bacterium]